MAIDYDRLMALQIPPVEHTYTTDDTILYALGLGLGHDPMNENELAFVYEKDLKALPTMACVLGRSTWMQDFDTGIDMVRIVHGEQSVTLHRPLPPAGTLTASHRIVDIVDKGAGKGAVIYTERIIADKDSGVLVATMMHTGFARGDGGFGGPAKKGPPPARPPAREPDAVCDLPTRPEAALIYRLSGDYNPLHAEPEFARRAGFAKPILHGLATFGVAGHAILKTLCGYDPARMTAMEGRFSAPVYPGETIRTEMWREGRNVSYQARVVERGVTAISNGRVELNA